MANTVGGWGWGFGSSMGPGDAASWTPASPTTDGGVSAEHWYRSDEAYTDAARSTACASDGDVVGNWTDKATAADHISQATTGNKPTWQNGAGDQLNGHPVLRGDGIDDYLQGAFTTGGQISQPNTILLVAQLGALAVGDGNNHFAMDGDDGSHKHIAGQSGANKWQISAGINLTGAASNGNWNIWLNLFNGAGSQSWHNGVSVITGNAGPHSMDGLTAFNYYATTLPWLGDIAEIIIYDANLSDADKNEVGTYLANRYGLSWTDI